VYILTLYILIDENFKVTDSETFSKGAQERGALLRLIHDVMASATNEQIERFGNTVTPRWFILLLSDATDEATIIKTMEILQIMLSSSSYKTNFTHHEGFLMLQTAISRHWYIKEIPQILLSIFCGIRCPQYFREVGDFLQPDIKSEEIRPNNFCYEVLPIISCLFVKACLSLTAKSPKSSNVSLEDENDDEVDDEDLEQNQYTSRIPQCAIDETTALKLYSAIFNFFQQAIKSFPFILPVICNNSWLESFAALCFPLVTGARKISIEKEVKNKNTVFYDNDPQVDVLFEKNSPFNSLQNLWIEDGPTRTSSSSGVQSEAYPR
jgi:hypothetical protein